VTPDPHDAPNRLRLVQTIGALLVANVLFAIYLSKTNLDRFHEWFVIEDGPIEWLTVVGLVLAAGICFYRIGILRPFRSKIFLLSLLFQGIVFLFGAGEEISWGQRIFDVQSGAFFQQHNSQGETNIHNLILSGKSVNRLIFGTVLGIFIALYFIALPLLYRRVEQVKFWVNELALPLPRLEYTVLYLVIFGLTQLIDGHRSGEILEFSGVWVFVMVLLVPNNKEVFSRMLLKR
jgi:hypothetical protein